MKNGTIELSVFLESIYSTAFEKAIFYTVILRAGSKQIELPQKKSLAQSNLISVLENLTLKMNNIEVQNSKNQAKVEVYSVQKYGRKKLLGQCLFTYELTNRRQIRSNFVLSYDQNAQIKFSYGCFKIESRVFSQKASNNSKNYSLKDANMQIQERLLAELGQKYLKQEKNTQQIDMQFEQNISQFQTQEISKVTLNSQNRQFWKEDFIQYQSQISSDQQSKQKQAQKFNKLSSLNTTNQLASQNRFDLQIQSKVLQFLFFGQQQSIAKSIRATKELLSGFSPSPTDLMQNMSFGNFNPLSMTQAGQKANKLSVIRPRTRAQVYQEWQNDDNLVNTVHQMTDQVKGNLGYIKLSKLTKLEKKSTQIRNRNKFLLMTNNQLLQNQKNLIKKLENLQQVIDEKDSKFEAELKLLKQQFSQVQKKLLDKYTQDMFFQRKLKQASSKIQNYQQKIKDLQGQIQIKAKQVQHLKQVINSYEDQRNPQNPIPQIKKEESKMQIKQRQPKFKRNNSGIFKSQKADSLKKNKLSNQKEVSRIDMSCPLQQNEEKIKGINPLFVQFFTSFRKSSIDISKSNVSPSVGSFKRARNYQNSQKLKTEKEPSITNKSDMFIEI